MKKFAIVGSGRLVHLSSERWPYTRCGKVISYTVKMQGMGDICLNCEISERRLEAK